MLQAHSSIALLYVRESRSLHRHVVRKLGDPVEAEDVVQDAYLRMLIGNRNDDNLDCPKAFLFTVASNLAIDKLRRGVRSQRLFESLDDDEWQPAAMQLLDRNAPDLEEQVDARARLNRIMAELRKLPAKCQKAFLLNRCIGLSYAETATQLSVTVSMVEKYIARAQQLVNDFAENDHRAAR